MLLVLSVVTVISLIASILSGVLGMSDAAYIFLSVAFAFFAGTLASHTIITYIFTENEYDGSESMYRSGRHAVVSTSEYDDAGRKGA